MDSMSPFKIVCDLETSGSDPIKNGVISCTVLIINEDLQVIDEFIRRVCPPDLSPLTWSLEAESVHGQSIAEVSRYMSNDHFCYDLLCFLAKYKSANNSPLPFICHASPNGKRQLHHITKKATGAFDIWPWFDYHFLEWCFRKAKFQNGIEMVWTFWKVISSNELISTVKMGRDAGYKKNRLNDWAERIGFNLNHHDDRSDAYCALEVYKYLVNKNQGGINV